MGNENGYRTNASGHYSWRSATMGSTRMARRAGIQHAIAETAARSAIMPQYVIKSRREMPNISDAIA
jgi:hypothetical protein